MRKEIETSPTADRHLSLVLNVSGSNQGITVQERRIILTATKDTLTVSGVDEADKSDKSSRSLARDEATLRRLTDSDVIRLLLEEKRKHVHRT